MSRLDSFTALAPALTMFLTFGMLVWSHLHEAAKILDRRRAELRKTSHAR